MSAGGDQCGGRGFTFVWTIQNFSHCVQRKGNNLSSADFLAFDATWNLSLYPRGKSDHNIECCLERGTEASVRTHIVIDCEVCVCTTNGKRLGVNKKENIEFARASNCTHTSLFGRKISFHLPQDTLVIHCHLWRSGSDRTETSVHCHQLTQVGVQKKTFSLEIVKFSSLLVDDKKVISMPPVEKDCPTMAFEVSLTGGTVEDSHVQIGIVFECVQRLTFFTSSISLLRYDGRSMKVMTDHLWLEESQDNEGRVRMFPHFLTRRELIADRASYLPADILTLKFEVALSDDNHCIEQVVYGRFTPYAADLFQNRPLALTHAPDQGAPHTLSSDLGLLYEGGVLSDFKLSAGGRAFPVHRLLLGARSSVFRNMFQNDMLEKRSDTLRIPDLDPDTLDRMLWYMYTDTMPDIGWQDAALLYYAADKYQLQNLRQWCSTQLGVQLDASNAAEVLELADRHGDADLKGVVQDFLLSLGGADALDSDRWLLLEDEKPGLVIEMLRDIFCKKVFASAPPRIKQQVCEVEGGFTFVWTIENFSHYVANDFDVHHHLRSTQVVALDATWFLDLGPESNGGCIACRLSRGDHSSETKIDCRICFCSVNGERLGMDRKENVKFARNSKVRHTALFERQISDHLPQDTLVVHCHLWEGGPHRTETEAVHCHQRTRIGVQKKTFFWNIERFSTLEREGGERVCWLPPVERNRTTLKFTLYLEDPYRCGLNVRIRIGFENVLPGTFCTYTFSVRDHKGSKVKSKTDQLRLSEDKSVFFPHFLTVEELLENKTSYLPGDVLTLQCDLALSDCHHNIEQVIYGHSTRVAVDTFHEQLQRVPTQDAPNTLKSDLGLLYESGTPYDFELSAGSKAFPLHRLLLAARSPVFRRKMFLKNDSDTLWNPDLGPDVLHQMLRYVYTDQVPDVRCQDAARLYCAADEYELLHLRQWCAVLLESSFEFRPCRLDRRSWLAPEQGKVELELRPRARESERDRSLSEIPPS